MIVMLLHLSVQHWTYAFPSTLERVLHVVSRIRDFPATFRISSEHFALGLPGFLDVLGRHSPYCYFVAPASVPASLEMNIDQPTANIIWPPDYA